MKLRAMFGLLLLLNLGLTVGLYAEDDLHDDVARDPAQMVPLPPVKNKKLRTKPPATPAARSTTADEEKSNYETPGYEPVAAPPEGRPNEPVRPWALRLNLLVGYGVTTTTNSVTQAAWTSGGYAKNIYLGAEGDFKFAQYFGAEGEGFFNFAPKSAVVTTGTTTSSQVSLRQLGALANAKLMYPMTFPGHLQLIPKLGAGFGLLGLNQSVEIGTTTVTTTIANIQTKGFALVAGADLILNERILLGADYALSLGASGSQTSGTSTSTGTTTVANTVLDFASAGFQRFRINGAFLVSDFFLVGAQYTFRLLSYTPVAATVDTQIRYHQFNAILGIAL
jgi:hypothetical protein